MAGLHTIKDAQSLYDQQLYGECIEICKQLMDNEESAFEAYLLLAKCGIMIIDPNNDESLALTITLIKGAYSRAKTINDYFRVKDSVQQAQEEKELVIFHRFFELFKEQPDALNDFFDINQKWIICKVLIETNNGDGEVKERLLKEAGFETSDEAYEHYPAKRPKQNVEGIIAKDSFDAAWTVFVRARNSFEENKDANVDFLLKYSLATIQDMTRCEAIIDLYSFKGIEDSVKLVRLKKLAEMQEYMLKAEWYPNGGAPVSLMLANREKTIQALSKTYDEIEKLDSEFVRPELPAVEAKQNVPKINNSSGGCYVATAVYGSYDCPEVWTLRRYRDFKLAKSLHGRLFIRLYYSISPTLVRCFGSTKLFKNLWKPYLDKMVKRLRTDGFEDTPYDDRTW